MSGTFKKISINQIVNYYNNPRHDIGKDEKDTLRKLFNAVGVQNMINLAKDVYEHGLLGNQQIVVVYDEKTKKYVVYEGNRRLACIKLLQNPDKFDFLDQSSLDTIRRLTNYGNEQIPNKLLCYVTDEEDALFIMERTHSGEDKGRGLKKWSSKEISNFKVRREEKKNCAYLINQYVQKYFDGYDMITLMPYTTVQRIFNNIEIKKKIGINVNDESTFTKERMELVINIAKRAMKEAKDMGEAPTRLYNKTRDIENIILPWLEEAEDKNSAEKEKCKGEDDSEKALKSISNNLGASENEQGTGSKQDDIDESGIDEKREQGTESKQGDINGSGIDEKREQGTGSKQGDIGDSTIEGDSWQDTSSKEQTSKDDYEKGTGGKSNLPYFFQGIQFGNLDPNNPDTHGIAEVCKEIKIFSDKNLVDKLPIAAAFLVRSIIEHSINYYSKKHKIQGQDKYIWDDIKDLSKLSGKIKKYKTNLPNYITDSKMRSYFITLFDNYEDYVDPLNWVVHRPEEYQLSPRELIDLPRRGLLALINFLIS